MKLRTIFFCGHKSPYGLAHLEPILESDLEVIAVVVATDERWQHFWDALGGKIYYQPRSQQRPWNNIKAFIKRKFPPSLLKLLKKSLPDIAFVSELTHRYQIPVWQVSDANEASFLQQVRAAKPDLILSAAYPQVFSKELISISKKGSVNFHPSLLPKYRGAHPHFWAIVKGEKVSGMTAHFMTENLDDGDIVAQLEILIEHCTYAEFYQKLIQETPNLVKLVDQFFQNQDSVAIPQNLSEASFFRNDREIHRRIFWELHTAIEIHNLCRTEQAFCFFRNVRIQCLKTKIQSTNRNLTNQVLVETGTIVDIDKDSLVVKARDACIHIYQIEENGELYLSYNWAKKYQIYIGEKLL
ncbi:MAG: hypothetical protein KME16_07170 [Scytolyngbya sp. HA4215-MV1]|jgi:methionyl-tRNA formyltransferase|nr:hypothetical protein [Scytolyngbya sp. HA4215-MV1]